jgi:hypothetical protein
MSPRKKYIVIAAIGGLGWALAIFSFFLLNYIYDAGGKLLIASQVEKGVFSPPSEQSLKNMESRGISRDVVTLFLRNINGSFQTGLYTNYILNNCSDRFADGTLTNESFAACATFTLSYKKHLEQVTEENLQPLNVILSDIKNKTE